MVIEAVTIVVEPTKMEVRYGSGDKLWYQAPGLNIYVNGSVPSVRLPSVQYLAVQECVARGIHVIDLKSVRSLRGAKLSKEKRQLRLFD